MKLKKMPFSILVFAVSAILFFIFTIPFRNLLPVFEFSEIRPSAVMNPVLGMFFGLPGVLGCAFGNLAVDYVSGVDILQCLIYVLTQIVYGMAPRLIWNRIYKDAEDKYSVDSMPKILMFCLTMIASSLAYAVSAVIATSFFIENSLSFGFFCFINDSAINLTLGFPLLILLNKIFNKSKISKSEKLLIITTGVELFGIGVIAVCFKMFTDYESLLQVEAIDRIYVFSLIYIAEIIMAALVFIGFSIRKELEEKNHDLQIASSIQISMLPECANESDSRFSLYASMTPAKEVGGDFYDHFMIDENHLAFTVADVSGKGMPAALFMMRAVSTLRGFAQSGMEIEEILKRTNQSLCLYNADKYFVTVWFGILDLESGNLQYVNAGHNPYVLRKANGNTNIIKAKSSMLLGGLDCVNYRANTDRLEKGDILYIYTDGVTEARNKSGEMFMNERMCSVVKSNSSPEKLCNEMLDKVNEFCSGVEQFDDITMLALKYNG